MGVNRKNGGFVVVEIMLLPVQSVCWNFHLRNLVLFSFYAIVSFKLTQLVEALFSNPTYTCFLGHNWYQNTIQEKKMLRNWMDTSSSYNYAGELYNIQFIQNKKEIMLGNHIWCVMYFGNQQYL